MTTTQQPTWFLGQDVIWNMTFLHKAGHPISPADWNHAMDLKHAGVDAESAAQVVTGQIGWEALLLPQEA